MVLVVEDVELELVELELVELLLLLVVEGELKVIAAELFVELYSLYISYG